MNIEDIRHVGFTEEMIMNPECGIARSWRVEVFLHGEHWPAEVGRMEAYSEQEGEGMALAIEWLEDHQRGGNDAN